MTGPVLKPVGQRPRCLHCDCELAPVFSDQIPGWPGSSAPGEYLFGDALREWKKANPGWHQFTGKYGRHGDGRFCTQTCGYEWAVAHTKPQP